MSDAAISLQVDGFPTGAKSLASFLFDRHGVSVKRASFRDSVWWVFYERRGDAGEHPGPTISYALAEMLELTWD